MAHAQVRRVLAERLPIALMMIVGACIPGLCRAAIDSAASPNGSAALLLSAAAGFDVGYIGFADQNFPVQNPTHSSDTDTTKNGIREVEHTIQTSVIAVTIGHALADVQVSVATTRTNAATGEVIDHKTNLATAHFDINTCPDVNGIAAGNVKVWVQAQTSRPSGPSSGGVSETGGAIRLVDGDDAHLVRTEMDIRLSGDVLGVDAGDGGKPFESSVGLSVTTILAPNLGSTLTPDYSSGAVTGDWQKYHPENAIGVSELLMFALTDQVAKATEAFWRSGKCITLKPSENSRNVRPREQVSITVDAVHKIDGEQVKAPIRGDLTGPASLEPSAKPIDPPAQFDYVAGENPDDKGEIVFKQVGKRGIGQETVTFRVKCRDVTVSLSGTVSLTGMGHDFEGRLSLEPTKLVCGEDGNYRATGSMSVKGKDSFHSASAEISSDCTQAANYSQPVLIVVRMDESDPKKALIQITPQLQEVSQTIKCRSTIVVLGHTMHPANKLTLDLNVLAVDMWGRMMARRQVTLGQDEVISATFSQGQARASTNTTLSVVAPSASP